MARIIATALTAVTIIGLGLVALQYRVESLSGAGLTGNDQEALNLTTNVSSDAMAIVGNAMPRLFVVVFLVFLVVLLLLIR